MYKSLTFFGLVIIIVSTDLVVCLLPLNTARGDATRQAQDDEQENSPKKTKTVHQAAKQIEQLRESAAKGTYKDPPVPNASRRDKPLLSWRVNLLPYLEEQALYDQFHKNEPWDSPHNKKLIDKMPAIYHTSEDLPPGKTVFQAPVSKFSVINHGSRGIRFADIRDGASKTILFLQVRPECAVTWTKPEDIEFDPANPLRCLNAKDGFLTVFCDGSVHRIPGDVDPEILRRLVDRRDGQPVSTRFSP